jgi:hypothetical protein
MPQVRVPDVLPSFSRPTESHECQERHVTKPKTEPTPTPSKVSLYVEASSPSRCFMPAYGMLFADKCFRGDDDRYYCSAVCAKAAEGVDLEHVEPFNAKSG